MNSNKNSIDLKKVVSTEVENFSDGFHTFRDLYDHRVALFAALVNQWSVDHRWKIIKPWDIHKSRRHNDGELCFGGGWFIVLADTPEGQISYHFEERFWDLFLVPEKECANKWDGHTPEDVVKRLLQCAAKVEEYCVW